MFEQTFVEGSGRTNKPWTTVVGFILQGLVLGMAVLVPMIWTDVLPAGQLKSLLVAPPPPPPPPPPPTEAPKTVVVKVIPRQFDAGRLAQPKSVPNKVAVIEESELPPPSTGGGVVGGMSGGVAGGVLSGILGASSAPVIAPPPPKVEATKAVQRVVVGGKVQEAMLVKRIMPTYPPLARSTRIQGHVILDAVISKEGTIQELKVRTGHPMLAPAAMEAVRQWVYKPTLLNGEPVEVTTEIDVNFTLQ